MKPKSLFWGLCITFLAFAAIFAPKDPSFADHAGRQVSIRAKSASIIQPDGLSPISGVDGAKAVDWKVISSGGRISQGGSYIVTGTACQTAVSASTSENYLVRHGFWQNFDSCTFQYPGDADGNGYFDNADITFLYDFLCQGGIAPDPLANGDPNGDCVIDTFDMVYLHQHLFSGGPAPVLCTCSDPYIGSCTAPDFCDSSWCDPVFLVCPGNDTPFRVYLRDAFGDPIVGETSVHVKFENCTEIEPCPQSEQYFTTIYPEAPSDENGMLVFRIAGGGCDEACRAIVQTTACVIDTVPVKALDANGDFIVTFANDLTMSSCNDYTGEGLINHSDFLVFDHHVGHRCDIDPCDMIDYQLSISPGAILKPNQEYTITLDILNNSFDSCSFGAVSFYADGFGLLDETFITTVLIDRILAPGQSASASTTYIIPDTSTGCLFGRFTTECCTTLVEASYCGGPAWICRPDSNICHEFHFGLDRVPILDTSWVRFLPPSGWTSWPIDIPEFPLYAPDSLSFSVCSPDLVNIGDSASVIFIACYDEFCFDFRTYEGRVMITSNTGDANGDCLVNVGDVVYLISHIFKGGPPPYPIEVGDVNCDGDVNVGDPVYLINHIFKGGPPPGIYDPGGEGCTFMY